jgi:hypothetical protein
MQQKERNIFFAAQLFAGDSESFWMAPFGEIVGLEGVISGSCNGRPEAYIMYWERKIVFRA